MRRVVRAGLLSLVVWSTSACGAFWRGATAAGNVSPSGLPWGEELTRRALVMGAFDQALARTAPRADGAPADALLGALFRGQVAYHAGRYEESVQAFAQADRLAEQRLTKSVTRGLGAVLVSDHALHYVPTRTERLFARYYSMLARLEAGDLPGATVEARRLSALLEAFAPDLDAGERATHATLRDAAGAVFESAGEWNDASVAYRNAALLRGVARGLIDSLVVQAPAGDSATLVLVVEEGFAAHYVPRVVGLPTGQTPRDASRRSRGRTGPFPPTVGSARPTASPRPPGDTMRVGTRDRTPAATPPAAPAPTDWGTSVGPSWTRAESVLDSLGVAPAGSAGAPGRARSAPPLTSQWLAGLSALPGGGVFDDDAWPAREARSDSATDASVRGMTPSTPEAGWRESVADDWTPRGVRRTRFLDAIDGGGWLRAAIPMLVRSRVPTTPVALDLAGVAEAAVLRRAALRPTDGAAAALTPLAAAALLEAGGLVSDAMGADARRRLPAQLARLAARVATRAAIGEAVRDEYGEAAGFAAQLVASALDRPDTRAWHLLPGRVRVLRFTVPAGRVAPDVRQGSGPNAAHVALTPFDAAPGTVTLRAVRLWRDPVGARGTLAQAIASDVPDDARVDR